MAVISTLISGAASFASTVVRAGLLPVNKLLSSTIDLEDINAAFDILDSGETVRQLVQFGADG